MRQNFPAELLDISGECCHVEEEHHVAGRVTLAGLLFGPAHLPNVKHCMDSRGCFQAFRSK